MTDRTEQERLLIHIQNTDTVHKNKSSPNNTKMMLCEILDIDIDKCRVIFLCLG